MTYKVAVSEILAGIEQGIVPANPGTYFNLFMEHLAKINRDNANFTDIVRDKPKLSREERELAYELGARKIRLYNLAARHLMTQELLIPKEEEIKFAQPEPDYELTYSPKGVVTDKRYVGLPPKEKFKRWL